MLPRPIRSIHHALLPLFAFLKLKSLCRLGNNRLDEKIEAFVDFDNGIFVEAGANDGLRQSNTYYFESVRRWRGLLVEPIPHLFERCRKNRPKAQVIHSALVAPDFPKKTIQIENAGLMSTIPDRKRNPHYSPKGIKCGRDLQHIDDAKVFNVPARTLSDLLDAAKLTQIDLLSLDVEGYEVEVLKGLDLKRHRPRFLCIEVRDEAAVLDLIGAHYRAEATLQRTPHYKDILYRLKD